MNKKQHFNIYFNICWDYLYRENSLVLVKKEEDGQRRLRDQKDQRDQHPLRGKNILILKYNIALLLHIDQNSEIILFFIDMGSSQTQGQ